MKDKIFNTEKKRQAALATFKTGVNTSFWNLMTQILEANIKVVTEQILSGKMPDGTDATKKQMDRLRDKLMVYKEVKDTPNLMAKQLVSTEGEAPSLDPFYTAEELKKERKNASD